MNRQKYRVFREMKLLCMISIIVGIHHYTVVKTHRMYKTESVNYDLWEVMLYQCMLISCN